MSMHPFTPLRSPLREHIKFIINGREEIKYLKEFLFENFKRINLIICVLNLVQFLHKI